MPNPSLGALSHYLRKIVAVSAEATEDGQLLERFASHRDEAAFTALVQRHGPMVWGVCRRVLQDEHQAEDVFQATFLVLVRQATAVTKSRAIGSWLYSVAFRAALRARAQAARREVHERQAPPMPVAEGTEEVSRRELHRVLDDEMNRLPEKYRTPLVLCYLEGKTLAEAARQLGCPLGTIATRLATARERLQRGLTRRGLTLATAVLTAEFSQNLGTAAVPAALAETTVKTALVAAVNRTLVTPGVPPTVAALTNGVLKAMFMTRLKLAAFVLVVLACFATAGGWIARQSLAAPAGESNDAEAKKADGKKADAPKPEAESIEGTWAMVSFEGKEVAPEEKADKWRITATMILTRKDEFRYKLNRSKTPNEIDILDEKNPIEGIVDIKDGTMKICLNGTKDPGRPTEFTAAKGSGRLLFVFKREGGPDGSEKLKSLLQERWKTAGEEFFARNQEFLAGRGTQEHLYQAARRLLAAEEELADKSRVTILANHLKRMAAIEKVNKERFDAGRIAVQDYRAAQYWRLEAEIWLERALQEAKK
jgi:RNA polymerase sigma factor (sigma-70 family)